MKVGNVTERTDLIQGPSLLDTDELDRSGIDLGATGRYVKYDKREKKNTHEIIHIKEKNMYKYVEICTYKHKTI